MQISTHAKLARIRAGLRQMDLTIKVKISPALISYYENGLKIPSPQIARKINSVLGEKVYAEK